MQKILIALFSILLSVNIYSKTSSDANFENIFHNWTEAFNHKDLKNSCALFSKNVIAQYKPVGEKPLNKNYAVICAGFKKIFADPTQNFKYKYKLHKIYRNNNLAAVRITWYLTTISNNKTITTQDEGIDIFKKNKDGIWQIVNYIGYEVPL